MSNSCIMRFAAALPLCHDLCTPMLHPTPDVNVAKAHSTQFSGNALAYKSNETLRAFRCVSKRGLMVLCACMPPCLLVAAARICTLTEDLCCDPECRAHQEWHGISEQLQRASDAPDCCPTAVFERVWTTPSESATHTPLMGIWRPVAPAGYVAVGDCLMAKTRLAPRVVTVLKVHTRAEPLVAQAVVCPHCPVSEFKLQHGQLPAGTCERSTAECTCARP